MPILTVRLTCTIWHFLYLYVFFRYQTLAIFVCCGHNKFVLFCIFHLDNEHTIRDVLYFPNVYPLLIT